jgi:hypothetical protein
MHEIKTSSELVFSFPGSATQSIATDRSCAQLAQDAASHRPADESELGIPEAPSSIPFIFAKGFTEKHSLVSKHPP